VRLPILIDTGPLVAIVNPNDSAHEQCVKHAAEIPAPPVTTWPVLAEAAYLLRRDHHSVLQLLRTIREGCLSVLPLGEEAAHWMEQFFERFGDHEPQFADASLLYLAERLGAETVFTLDRRDFSIYRLSDNRALQIIP